MAICNSINFEQLSQRIGQTVEVGFALSSDIWITNLISEIENKTVKSFLDSHNLSKYSDRRSRHTAHFKYSKQFVNFNYLTAALPATAADLKIDFNGLANFLNYRAILGSDAGTSVYKFISGLLSNSTLGQGQEHLELVMMIAFYFDIKPAEEAYCIEIFNSYKDSPEEEIFFKVLRNLQGHTHHPKDSDYARLDKIVQKSDLKIFKTYTATIQQIDTIGYINTDAVEVARGYHNSNKGLSPQNECLRNAIFRKFKSFMMTLSTEDFNEYFELNKVFVVYMNAFDNEQFNQNVKGISMHYIKKLLKRYTEKRSKDYQDIKKFVSAVFLDLGFLKEKEIKELFKTKRKKVATTT